MSNCSHYSEQNNHSGNHFAKPFYNCSKLYELWRKRRFILLTISNIVRSAFSHRNTSIKTHCQDDIFILIFQMAIQLEITVWIFSGFDQWSGNGWMCVSFNYRYSKLFRFHLLDVDILRQRHFQWSRTFERKQRSINIEDSFSQYHSIVFGCHRVES